MANIAFPSTGRLRPRTAHPYRDLDVIDARMREIIAEAQPFVRDELPAEVARKVFAGHRFKLEIIDDASTDPMSATSASDAVRTYENPPAQPKGAPPFDGYPGFIDLCRGPHVPHTGYIPAFALTRTSAAYWCSSATTAARCAGRAGTGPTPSPRRRRSRCARTT